MKNYLSKYPVERLKEYEPDEVFCSNICFAIWCGCVYWMIIFFGGVFHYDYFDVQKFGNGTMGEDVNYKCQPICLCIDGSDYPSCDEFNVHDPNIAHEDCQGGLECCDDECFDHALCFWSCLENKHYTFKLDYYVEALFQTHNGVL